MYIVIGLVIGIICWFCALGRQRMAYSAFIAEAAGSEKSFEIQIFWNQYRRAKTKLDKKCIRDNQSVFWCYYQDQLIFNWLGIIFSIAGFVYQIYRYLT